MWIDVNQLKYQKNLNENYTLLNYYYYLCNVIISQNKTTE